MSTTRARERGLPGNYLAEGGGRAKGGKDDSRRGGGLAIRKPFLLSEDPHRGETQIKNLRL